MSEDIHEWVKQRLNEGEDSNALRERLSAHSYDPSIVDEVMSSTSSTNTENKKENVKELKGNNFDIINTIKEVIKPDKSKIILTLVLVIFYTIFIYQLFQFQDALSSDVIDNINQIKKTFLKGMNTKSQ